LIQPNAPVIYSITGAVGNAGSGLIRLVGAKRVTIDGRFSGTGRYLRFINRQQAGVTLLLHQEAQKDTIRNCIVEGVNNTFGIIQFGGSTVSDGIGNDSNAIIGCLIRDTLGTLATHNIANTSISCSGTIGRENDRIAILDNEMVNFGVNAINMTSSGTGNFWNISNNKIYQTITKNNLMQIVLVQGGSGHTIINNSIGGSAINRSGAAFRSTAGIIAIDITSAVGTNFPIMVSGNVISNLGVTGTTTGVSALRMAGGNLIISNNTIGGGMMPHDTIMNCYDGAIHIIGGASALVDNNLISHMNYYRASLNRNTGIHIVTSTASPLTVQRNTIQNISGNQTGTGTTSFRPAGITVTLAPVTGLTITQNTIRNIRNFNTSAGAYLASGIFYAGGASTTPIITQNRIRNIGAVGTGTGASAPEVSGICILSATNAVVANNQISLGDSALNQSRVYGIFDGTGGSNTYAYNSIFINGHTSAGVNHSSGFHRSTTTSSINFRNNLIYNKRTTSGTGFAYAISSASSSNFAGANFNYNMFILNDTARLLELPSGTSIGWSAMNNLYPSTYNTNWAERSSIVAPHAIFIDTLNGNLGIDSSSSAAWYVNGKGIRIQNLSGDFNNVTNVRSTEINSGATDIGSVEFTPTSMPPIAHADKAPAANDSTRFYFASKLVAKAVWGSSGTLPSVVNLRYYSGTNPVNTPTGSTFANAYYDLQALGGSGYNHNLTLMLDSAVMGSIASVNRTQIANYQGALSNWTRYANTIPSGNNGYFKAFGLTNGGAFTFTDSAFNPLPVSLNYFTAKVSGNDVLLNWQTASEKNNRGFYIERSADGKFFNEFDFVFGKGNSNILCDYSNTDINPFTNSSILYYRLKQVDFDGNYSYSKSMMVRLDNKTLNAPIIYPNPVLTDMYVELNSPSKANVSVQLIDIHGKEVYNQLIQVNDGINKIIVPEIATLHAGVYLAKIVVDGEVYTMKVIKQ
ncbi:MAG: T9SS type A sorting domain-containing protein, partial [Bacteroidia bacterium]